MQVVLSARLSTHRRCPCQISLVAGIFTRAARPRQRGSEWAPKGGARTPRPTLQAVRLSGRQHVALRSGAALPILFSPPQLAFLRAGPPGELGGVARTRD